MPRIVRHPRLSRAVTALMLMVFLQGCMQWKAAPLEPQRAPAGQLVRVTLDTGDRRTLTGAYIARDSLISSSAEPIPLARIRRIERRAVDGATTGVALVAGALAVLAIAVMSIDLGRMGDIGCVAGCPNAH
jgi:hypothetical protein